MALGPGCHHGWIEGLINNIIDCADKGCDEGWLGGWEPIWLDGGTNSMELG